MRIKFKKGEQRKFIDRVLENTGCPSLRELINRGLNVNYSSLKNYCSERRTLPLEVFESLCSFGKISKGDFNFEIVNDFWGQIKGGRVKFK